jgi:hypothetical protein
VGKRHVDVITGTATVHVAVNDTASICVTVVIVVVVVVCEGDSEGGWRRWRQGGERREGG